MLYTRESFNQIIYPNEVIAIYNHSNNNEKINLDGFFTIEENNEYFGMGTTHLIHFKGERPYNKCKMFIE